ncbi:MAG: Fe2+-dependent dioxygenase [Pseudomonadota bacterium]
MIIASILDQAKLTEAQQQLQRMRWVDGRQTAGSIAANVKDNSQADLSTRDGANLARFLMTAIGSNPDFQAAALPKKVSTLRISKTPIGGTYGRHFDNAIMSSREGFMKTDLSFTLFLSQPDTYTGGALSIDHDHGSADYRLPAGDLVLYPSGALHEVTPVESGERIVCVGWIQSMVPDPEQRRILYDMKKLGDQIKKERGQEAPEVLSAGKIYTDLLRHWAAV